MGKPRGLVDYSKRGNEEGKIILVTMKCLALKCCMKCRMVNSAANSLSWRTSETKSGAKPMP